jgi:hypothetical protein
MPAARTERTLVTRIEKQDAHFDAPVDRWSKMLVLATFLVPDSQFMGPGDASRPLGVVGGSRTG